VVALASAPQPVPATTNPAVADPTTATAGQAISTSAAADAPRQAKADLTAHLPTNLLDLDEVEPTGEQAAPAENNAGSAWNPGLEAADLIAEASNSAGESSATEHAEAAAQDVAEVTEPPAAAVTDAPQDPAPQPNLARRGRPRKVRPEAQAEPAAATTAEGPAPAPAAEDTTEQQPAAAVLTTDGDDPFGLDPLL
jgi:hypothetical protein